jgi:ribose transport system substrate-binding protein
MVGPVHSAIEAGVPVVIMDSGLKTERYVSFVATDNYKGGVLAGEHMGKLLGGKGNVILLRYAVGSASTEEREAGFLEALKKFPDIKIISQDQYAGPTRETGYQASQNLLNRYGNEVNGIFCPCEPPTIAMAKALRDIGKGGGKVKMVGLRLRHAIRPRSQERRYPGASWSRTRCAWVTSASSRSTNICRVRKWTSASTPERSS